ncbi:MAG: RdgB/HAM1 family non-canonical purine NTP pyrophosphatase [Calditrichae bacterium]|nr:RdgB/HAM1 family non-canonical purine NTP pyrophosphatase [Calditrichia bacterium]
MKTTVVLATRNAHKLREIAEILAEAPVVMRSLEDYPQIPEIAETAETFAGNALIKAREVFAQTGCWTLSDDSGLEVDALQGAPGVYSARYAGEDKDPAANNAKLLAALQEVPDAARGAQFRCVVAIKGPEVEKIVEGVVRGRIIRELRGSAGFGYDPLFIPEGFQETYAELGAETKNRISHRAIAFQTAAAELRRLLAPAG